MTEDKARELAQRFGVRMCDENGETHGEELYCLGLDDIIDMAKALAQPEQEPVAWYYEIDGSKAISFAKDGEPNKPWQGLYTQPDPDALHAAYMSGFYDGKKAERRERSDRWVGLTDEEINSMWKEWKDALCLDHKTWTRAVEAKLKEKNT